ncbi:MAG: hypothetical protein MI976_00640 [Pseudomonadales bacterium]|nr:hypothetical protein [Pseudomonadales bacterium]
MSLTTLYDDVTQLNDIDDKDAGSLIKPDDWNKLVASVKGIGDALIEYIDQTDNRIGDLQAVVDPLPARIDNLEADLNDLKDQIAPLLDNYVITMRTGKVNYALGELSEITAEVRDLQGNPVTTRPWVDFVTTWGQLRAADGFATDVGASGKSISVRANSEGIARVLVKSAHTENLTAAQEVQVATAMEATLPSGQFFYQAIMEAPTPTSTIAQQAFQVMNFQYEAAPSAPMQLYIDSYQQFPEFQILPQWNPSIFTNWKNYRTVVVALVKDDSDPTTPDAAKGTSSIQINFRDWIGPWIDGYVNDFEIFVPEIQTTVGSYVGSGGFALDLELIHNLVETQVGALGAVGRQRYYNGFISAVDRIEVTDPPRYMADLRQTMKQAVSIQQTQEAPGLALKGNQLGKTPGMTAMTGAAKNSAAAKDVADSTLGTYQALEASSKEMNDKIVALDNDLQVTHTLSTNINSELSSIGQNVLRINTLDTDSVQGQVNLISAQIGQINEVLKRGS